MSELTDEEIAELARYGSGLSQAIALATAEERGLVDLDEFIEEGGGGGP